MMDIPAVSVVIPVYNGERFLAAAIESILGQTFTDFELIVIDDGSTDSTSRIASRYCSLDRRVRLISQANQGPSRARDSGVNQARGKYLAWLDSDDLAHPHRLAVQAAFLDANPDVVILGGVFQQISENGEPIQTHVMPADDTSIRWQALFHSPFAQSTVMQRLEILERYQLKYSQYAIAEDYDLSSRMLQFGKGVNLIQVLSDYRFHPHQLSTLRSEEIGNTAVEIARRNIRQLGLDFDLGTVSRLRNWYYRYPRFLRADEAATAQVLLDLVDAFGLQPGLDNRQVRRIRGRNTLRFVRAALKSPALWKTGFASSLKGDRLQDAVAYGIERIWKPGK